MKSQSGSACSSLTRSLWTYTSTERSPVAQRRLPDQREQLLTRHDPVLAPGELDEQVELAHREGQRMPRGEGDRLTGPHLELPHDEDLDWARGLHVGAGFRAARAGSLLRRKVRVKAL